ncbi:MAG: DUF839 domain-containing protein [Elusimicrobia bacterium]|nr:DUF839 domain-containing protein [Elusimicrobiota bacterium]
MKLFLLLMAAVWPMRVFSDGCFDGLVQDEKGFFDLPKGYSYEVLIESGRAMADGQEFPHRPDLNVYIPLVGDRAFLLTSHELALDQNPEWGAGSITRHYLVNGKIQDSRMIASHMRNNCSGSLTPWGTILTNEEMAREPAQFYPEEGFIWEVDPITGSKTKLPALGRFSHESSLVASDGKVYLTEDRSGGGLIYRFIPHIAGNLSKGRLEAFNRSGNSWVLVENTTEPRREMAALGATLFNRPEGLTFDAAQKYFYFSETGEHSEMKGDPFGRIYRVDLKNFSSKVIWEGRGEEMSNPDNLLMDHQGRLWVAEDQFDTNLAQFGPNEIWMMNKSGAACAFARLRDDACEPTGLLLTPHEKEMFVNFQCDRQADKIIRISGF